MNRLRTILLEIFKSQSILIVHVIFVDIWHLRGYIIGGCKFNKLLKSVYYAYLERYGSFVGIGAQFDDIPTFPHGLAGIFISNKAHIGKGCTIFQQVTIGSNMIKGSKNQGSPTIGNNVYIGCGAKIIGNITIGDNARIGANAIVVKDVPANSVTIVRGTESIIKEEPLDNSWVAVPDPSFV